MLSTLMNTVLLVGGDLCERTAARLSPALARCTGLRRGAAHTTNGNIPWVRADLTDPGGLAAALVGLPAITHVLYAAAPGERSPAAYAAIYPEGLRHLLDALPHPQALRRCVLVDSTAIWAASDGRVDETTPARPEDFRGRAMLAAEAVLQARLPSTRFPRASGTALRLSGLYGPGRLRLIDGLRAGRITAPAGPGHWASRIHVDDAAQACAHLLMLDAPESAYIGTDDHPQPTADFYDALADLAGVARPARVAHAPDGKQLSNARLRASGWTPRWPDAIAGYAACLHAPAPPSGSGQAR